MWDNWEAHYECLRRVRADLPNFVRAFNKASVKNRGSKSNPGPTLNLARVDGQISFEFAEKMADPVLAQLRPA